MKFHDGVLCSLSTRTSATAAGFSRSSKLSSSSIGQAVRTVRAGGMDRPSQHKSHPARTLYSSQPGGPSCWVIYLSFDLTGSNAGHFCIGCNIMLSPLHFSASIRNKFREPDFENIATRTKMHRFNHFSNALEGKKENSKCNFLVKYC
jgi:hypothetical protein